MYIKYIIIENIMKKFAVNSKLFKLIDQWKYIFLLYIVLVINDFSLLCNNLEKKSSLKSLFWIFYSVHYFKSLFYC